MSTDRKTYNLATFYRPKNFSQVCGSKAASKVLSAVAFQNPAQQILLIGPSGTGKTTLARAYAAALFCQNPIFDGSFKDACTVCEPCQEIFDGTHPDLIEVDAASYGGVDRVRDLASSTMTSPMKAPYKVYIVDEAHGLTASGSQAFLKTLEEPPSHVVFVLATTDPQKLPDALRGRCLTLRVDQPTFEDLAGNLQRIADAEKLYTTPQTLDKIIEASDPSLGVRGSVNTLSKVSFLLKTKNLDEQYLDEILGVVSKEQIDTLSNHISAGQQTEALALTNLMLSNTPARYIVLALTNHYRQLLLKSTLSSSSNYLEQYGLFVKCPSEPHHILLNVGKACQMSTKTLVFKTRENFKETRSLILNTIWKTSREQATRISEATWHETSPGTIQVEGLSANLHEVLEKTISLLEI